MCVCIAGISKSIGQRSSRFPILLTPPWMLWLNDIHFIRFDGMASFVLRNEHLVKLLAWPDSDMLNLAVWSYGPDQVHNVHARNLRREDLPTMHLLDAPDHKKNSLLKRDPKASHARIGNRDSSIFALF